MGFRNPFRFSIDPANGWVYLADYGPDRDPPTTNRGPEGLVELNVIKAPGNYGWPFCHGDNQPYAPYNPDTGVVGAKFNCYAPVNNSPNNTGLTSLQAGRRAEHVVRLRRLADLPRARLRRLRADGRTGLPVRRRRTRPRRSSRPTTTACTSSTSGRATTSRRCTSTPPRRSTRTNPFLPGGRFNKPMDMEFGPDGSLYLLEWGTNFGGGNNDSGPLPDRLHPGRPVADRQGHRHAHQRHRPADRPVQQRGHDRPRPGDTLSYLWTFGDGTTSTAANPSQTYTANGNYTAQLKVTDSTGKTGFANVQITVGNTAPVVTITTPANGGMLDLRRPGPVPDHRHRPGRRHGRLLQGLPQPGARATTTTQHETTDYPGCSGTIATDLLGGHPDGANLFYVLNARYTDNGGAGGAAPLTGYAQAILQPKHKQAEYYSSQSGIRVVDQAGAESGKRIGDISNNDWIAFTPMSLSGITTVSYRLSSPSGGGSIELRADSPTGTLLATTTGAQHRRLGQLPVHGAGERRRPGRDAHALPGVQGQRQQLVRSRLAHLRRKRRRHARHRHRRRRGRARPGRSPRSTAAS